MKLNQVVSARYGCSFPAKHNKAAIDYYKEHSKCTRCEFIFDLMIDKNDFELHRDEYRYMCDEAPEVWAELLEAFLYAAYQDVKTNGRKPRNVIVDFDED